MTVTERRSLREYVARREMERVQQRIQEYGLTMVCAEAMRETGCHPGRARQLHLRCQGEERGNSGCLCTCHDDVRQEAGGVQSGTAVEMGSDTAVTS
jgi:hypothetical protein